MHVPHRPIDQQVIVITGATSGIGLCTALLAAERGAKVVLAARSAGTLDAVAEQIRFDGGEAVVVAADVGVRADVARIAETAVERFGGVDTWVNNAGVSVYGRLDEVSEEDSRRLFDTNFWGVVNGSLEALALLRRRGGALINIGSEVCESVLPLQGMYSTSKHAVKGFTDALRVEVEQIDRAPVSITLIQPAAVNTPYPQHARNYMDREPKLPSRMLDPHRVAEAILKAAVDGGRDVKVGAMAYMNTTMARLLPRVSDLMSARRVDQQQADVEPQFPQGALHRPHDTGRIYGSVPFTPPDA
ncbi:SDR family oxidoreductase [Lysobacter korlensis]|uniref:SDR family oxidoreductase n=1 Tax=Lysobacter korlensis TaxID=553636 RepID=A0ABV6RRV7_9GAMM